MNETAELRCWAEIDVDALRHNARVAREHLATNVALLAVIKANGYGHGLQAMADALRDEVQFFGVANLQEAREARTVAPHPIIILGPALAAERAGIVRDCFIPSVSSAAEAAEFSRVAAGSAVALNCKIDTGMGRMGIAERLAVEELKTIAALPNVTIHSVSTHLPSVGEDEAYTREQLARFEDLLARIRREVRGMFLVHSLPSAGVFQCADSAGDIVRAGLMLYGASHDSQRQAMLRPALALKSRVALLRPIEAGQSVSYGRTFIAPRPMRVATLSIGYADGVPRSISNRDAAVLIRGRRCPILGRVTMDLIMANVTDVPGVDVGEEVVLIGRQEGEQILATEMAERAGTIAWEIFTGIGSRVARVYV